MTTILIAEDEPGIALGLENDLRLEGYAVEVVTDGDAAFAQASSGRFDLVVLDIMLPRKDGFMVCRDLRRTGITTPIIMLTARAQDADKVLGLGLGADDYVTKPFSPMELCARIKAILRRVGAEPGRVLHCGSMQVDFASGRARRRGVPVTLTSLEFKVLATLVAARGRLVSREQLIERVWGAGVSITDRVVDNHILNLRRKLEDEPARPRHLVSVRGLGYRFDESPENLTTS